MFSNQVMSVGVTFALTGNFGPMVWKRLKHSCTEIYNLIFDFVELVWEVDNNLSNQFRAFFWPFKNIQVALLIEKKK